MSTTYPGTLQTFTDPSGTSPLASGPDHAQLHTDVNDTLEATQTTLGTTAGTSVLKNFAAGDFPSRINSSGVLQQTIEGTLNNAVLGSPTTTGGTINSSLIKTKTIGSAVYQGTVSGTTTIDLSTATRHLVNMPNSAGAVTLAVSNVSENQPFMIEVLQGTAGLGTITWFSTIRWAGSATPTPTTTASRKDTFGFIPTGTTTFDGFVIGQNI